MRRAHWKLACSVLCGVCAPFASAYQPLITDDTSTQGAGGNQLEAAINRVEITSEGITTTTKIFPLVYTRGVTDALDVYASVSHVRVGYDDASADARGHGNPVLGLKWRLHESEAHKFSIGLKPEIQFGTSADDERRGLGNGRNGYSAVILATQETGFGAVHANYAYARVNYALESNRALLRSNVHRFSVAPVFDLGSSWAIVLDAGITTNPLRNERAKMGYGEVGAIWAPSKDLEFAVGWIRFFGDGEPRASTLTAGITWRFR